MRVANRPEMRHRSLLAALRGRLSADGTPEADAGDLRDPLDVEHRPEDWVGEGHVFNHVLAGWHRTRELARPLFPGRFSPEVIDPQKAAFLQVETQTIDFLLRQADSADIGGHQVCASE